MLNKKAMKLLKLLSKSEFLNSQDIEEKYHIKIETADYLVRLGFAKYQTTQYTPLFITFEGLTYLTQNKYDFCKFIIPMIVSFIMSSIAIVISTVALC